MVLSSFLGINWKSEWHNHCPKPLNKQLLQTNFNQNFPGHFHNENQVVNLTKYISDENKTWSQKASSIQWTFSSVHKNMSFRCTDPCAPGTISVSTLQTSCRSFLSVGTVEGQGVSKTHLAGVEFLIVVKVIYLDTCTFIGVEHFSVQMRSSKPHNTKFDAINPVWCLLLRISWFLISVGITDLKILKWVSICFHLPSIYILIMTSLGNITLGMLWVNPVQCGLVRSLTQRRIENAHQQTELRLDN